MLKQLELIGFKSFADKTQFDFSPGVTGIIGPNGSGKSNVVDAVRWVLGEQSARSLRGGEMTDVIFNGSASRRSLGLAEVSMVFNNTKRTLATDAEEVRITRRVYRSGEGEYLINNQPCRLKDIKDLFLGSGAGTDAYCIIQQGQVDVLLQTAPKDRRTIFEEAAGISRYRARKTEALRRLERVDSNLQRLRDILDEVEKQLRSVKLQAAKAQRYQEYTGRLRELRVGLSLKEYHHATAKLQVEEAALEVLREQLAQQTSVADERERRLVALEQEVTRLEEASREQEGQLSGAREQIGAEEARQSAATQSVLGLEEDLRQNRQRLSRTTLQVAALADACRRARDELSHAERQELQQRQQVLRRESEMTGIEERLATLRAGVEQHKEHHLEQMRQAARLHNDTVSYKAQLDNLARERSRLQTRSDQAAEHLASLDVELEELTRADEQLQEKLVTAREGMQQFREEREMLDEDRDQLTQRAADRRAERSGLASRIEVLQGLERSHEGLGTGVREVFTHLSQPEPGPWRTVLGLVAEVFTVRREFAPLIDLALGDRAQRFVVGDVNELAQALRQRGTPFSGRVSFMVLPVAVADNEITKESSPLSLHPGVVARADQVVRCDDSRFAPLASLLLGKTLLVLDLGAARAIAALKAGYRCITLQGELVEADGTLTIGTHHAETGILSRKSELRELREQVASLDRGLEELEREQVALRERLEQLDGQIEHAQSALQVLVEQAGDMRWRIGQHKQRREGLSEEVTLNRSELTSVDQEIERLEQSWQHVTAQATQADDEVQAARQRVEDTEREIRELDSRRSSEQQVALAGRVALAQVEERLSALRTRQEELDADLDQRGREFQQGTRRVDDLERRIQEATAQLLSGSSALALWYRIKESAERHLADWAGQLGDLRRTRQALFDEVKQDRGTWRQQQEQAHERELAVNQLRHIRDALAARLAEDYQLDLEILYQQHLAEHGEPIGPVPSMSESGEPLPPDEEITDLKKRLSKLGSVNLESIDELTELEARHGALQTQFDDLNSAQRSLLDIINKINTDSRRLFTETFDTIRTHFQELFRKLFGGGMADVVLEEGVDVLDAGIEVVARPPGKELRSISLMSGGEKTMTAVALLLAIFRSKPSPFCILDEVDAALDEANVSRFTAVVREFMDRSQFIIITHHKRTMSAADVLYGVTMQESGISSRFSVRFEDWAEDEQQAA